MQKIYNRPATPAVGAFGGANLAHTRLMEADKNAGLTPPTTGDKIKSLIANEPTPDQVANQLAKQAFENHDPEKFLEESLQKINRAQAAEQLRASFNANYEIIYGRLHATLQKNAAKDLQPAFNKLAKELTTAASKLDPDNPLDQQTVIQLDNSKHYKQAQQVLAMLGPYAGIYTSRPQQNGPRRALESVLPIIELPPATVEQIEQGLEAFSTTTNTDQLTNTYLIRDLAEDLGQDTDRALIKIAAGHYKDVHLSLATPDELQARIANADRAFERQRITT